MTTWTRPFGPASLRIDAELESAKIAASLNAYLAHSKRRGAVVALSRGNRLEHGGGALRGRPRQGAGLRAAHAGAGVVVRDHHAEPDAG